MLVQSTKKMKESLMKMGTIKNDKDRILWLMAYYGEHNYQIDEFNMIGVRNTDNLQQDVINDFLGFWTKDEIFICKGTTDPSVHFTKNTVDRNPAGTFHLIEGFHRQIWCVGQHKGYEALVNNWQHCKPTRGWRDANYNFVRDPEDVEVCDYFGINFHRMHPTSVVGSIGRYSAGCQVVQHPKDFKYIMDKVKASWMYRGTYAKTVFNYMLFEKDEMPKGF